METLQHFVKMSTQNVKTSVVPVKEMDALQISSCESDPTKVLTSKVYESTNFRNNSHSVRVLEDLQSLRKSMNFMGKSRIVLEKRCLPELMKHVIRLPLLKPDILFDISEEPLLKNTPKCKDYVFYALQFIL
ncbi:uncharacterized protein LOC100568751 [Acyrthosiphon pisum]|uniref:Uncharacterized protein n=1 Tax=Acyrthosiphon pisum TaxID=7029 RepID=A0A8R2JX54_ACYPI|nr:uncharacterized protein LOC100568751 [Acyrthosiphon pisum]